MIDDIRWCMVLLAYHVPLTSGYFGNWRHRWPNKHWEDVKLTDVSLFLHQLLLKMVKSRRVKPCYGVRDSLPPSRKNQTSPILSEEDDSCQSNRGFRFMVPGKVCRVWELWSVDVWVKPTNQSETCPCHNSPQKLEIVFCIQKMKPIFRILLDCSIIYGNCLFFK